MVPRSRRAFLSLAAGAALGGALVPGSARSALAAPASQAFRPYWVQNFVEAELWSGTDRRATVLGRAAPFSYFKVLQPQQGPRLYVENPLGGGTAWIAAAAIGPSGEPPAWYLAGQPNPEAVAAAPPTPAAAPSVARPVAATRPGRIIGGANVRSRPIVAPESWVGRLGHNAPVQVSGEVTDTAGEVWYRVAEGQLVHSSLVRLPGPFSPHPGRLIVAELTEPVIVTAYEDGAPLYAGLALKGTVAWATPTGFFTIRRRVENETMDSATLGIPRAAPGGYFLKDVLYTQYFTGDGASIHYNWWSGNFGYSGSHGCLGMNLEDARWFWEWASVGTPLIIQA